MRGGVVTGENLLQSIVYIDKFGRATMAVKKTPIGIRLSTKHYAFSPRPVECCTGFVRPVNCSFYTWPERADENIQITIFQTYTSGLNHLKLSNRLPP